MWKISKRVVWRGATVVGCTAFAVVTCAFVRIGFFDRTGDDVGNFVTCLVTDERSVLVGVSIVAVVGCVVLYNLVVGILNPFC